MSFLQSNGKYILFIETPDRIHNTYGLKLWADEETVRSFRYWGFDHLMQETPGKPRLGTFRQSEASDFQYFEFFGADQNHPEFHDWVLELAIRAGEDLGLELDISE